MRMPRSIKVGHRRFEVINWDPKAANAEDAFGDCRQEPPVIRIVTKGRTPADRAEVMIHEILHLCWYGLPDKPEEESAVNYMGINLSQIWADNPDLVAWISHCLTPRPVSRH